MSTFTIILCIDFNPLLTYLFIDSYATDAHFRGIHENTFKFIQTNLNRSHTSYVLLNAYVANACVNVVIASEHIPRATCHKCWYRDTNDNSVIQVVNNTISVTAQKE